jgi:hypothetical protein
MADIRWPAGEIIKLPDDGRRIAAEIVASLNRRGIPAAEVVFSDLGLSARAFGLMQAERLTEAAAECEDSDVRELIVEMAAAWLRLPERR